MNAHADALAAALDWLAANPYAYLRDAALIFGVTPADLALALELGE